MGNLTGVILIGIAGIILGIVFVLVLISKFLKKASPGQALIKTGLGLKIPKISTSSTFAVPILHKVEVLDITVKTIRITRRAKDSLSCQDGIRAEVEVDFYIQINDSEGDIREVASKIGCNRASEVKTLRELFEAKFADALKTAGSKLTFDELYQNRLRFKDEILKALGQVGNTNVVLSGYKLTDAAIQYLEQLPLSMHDENNVLDAKGRKEIAQRTSFEAEEANKRLRLKEITISEQNRQAKTRQLEIDQDLAEKEAKQEREIKEAKARENALSEKTAFEQEKLSTEAKILNDKLIKIAEELKQKEILAAQIEREEAIQVQSSRTRQAIEISKIEREVAEAEALKLKLKKLEENAIQEAEKIKAEEQMETVRALEIANRQKQIEVISAQKLAEVETQTQKVAYDVKAYELITVAKAKLDAAQLDAQAAELQAKSIVEVGKAEAEALRMKLEAENLMNEKVLIANALNQIIPLLPTIIEKLMLPAEKIESIKVLNITGMDKMTGMYPNSEAGNGGSNVAGSLVNSIISMGMFSPILKEVVNLIKDNDSYGDLISTLKGIPGAEALFKDNETVTALIKKEEAVN